MQALAEKMWAGSRTAMPFTGFEERSKKIGEGPSLNIRGKIGKSNQSVVACFNFDKRQHDVKLQKAAYAEGMRGKALSFSGKNSFAKLLYKEIGYDYTVSFWINPTGDNPDNAIAFKSANSAIKLRRGNTGKLGFSRDGYDFDFDYTVPENTWTHIVIAGTNKGTSLYVNGKLQKKLYDDFIQFTDKDKTKMIKMETLFFPLQMVGGFNGKIDELKIWDKVLPDIEIENLK
jgi:hexosaminidase